jgi:hypothetical protein
MMQRLLLSRIRRRGLLMLAVSGVASGRVLGAGSLQWRTRVIVSEEPLRQIRAGGPSGLLGLGAGGTLWALSLTGDAPQRIGAGLDADSPLAIGHGRIAARDAAGGLWIWERGATHTVKRIDLSVHAGLLILPLGIIATVVTSNGHRLVRLDPGGSAGWSEVARSAETVMPDARPLQVDLEGRGDGGHVVVLGGPDAERYGHGVLGDAVEATRLSYLERHSLQVIRELSIPAPFVIEDISPRPVLLRNGTGMLTMRSGPAGAQLMLVAADTVRADRLRIEALGDALGTRHRWLAPTTNGHRWMAVHTPHLGGMLHEYRQDGQHLVSRAVGGDVSTHHIGSRELDLSVWLGAKLVVPDQEGRRLRVLDGSAGWTEVASVPLPARVESTVGLPGNRSLAALLGDGRVVIAGAPEAP